MNAAILRLPILLFALFLAWPTAGSGAAEFDIDGQRTILRQIQYCDDCGAALLVTGVHPGTLIRCPDCGKEQARIPDQHVLTQAYQTCSICDTPLDAHGRHPGEVVECGNCHTRQVLSRDAFPNAAYTSGLGYIPGFPPGSRKKTMLYSPDRPDAAITPIPLEEAEPTGLVAARQPAPNTARTPIPPPQLPAHESARPEPRVTVPSVEPLQPLPPVATPELPPLAEAHPTPPSGRAVDVPVVTADMFGGKRQATGTAAGASQTPLSGAMVARVDGTAIFSAEVDRVAGPVMEKLRSQATPEERAELATRERELRSHILERLIDRELVMKEAARIGHRPDITAVRRREAELTALLGSAPNVDIHREAERDIVMSDMRARFAEKPASVRPEEVREFYRAHQDQLTQPRLLAVSQLAIFADRTGKTDSRPYQDIAADIAAALERGERFDDLRARHDEFAPAAGLDMPEPALLPESAYASHIATMAGNLRKGAVFGPLPMSGAIVFGKVVDERPAGPIPFDQVEKEIHSRLESEAAERNLEAWLKSLRQRSVVELFLDGQ